VSVKELEGSEAWMIEGSEASSLPAFWLPSFPASKLWANCLTPDTRNLTPCIKKINIQI
jgi:hypothetical protein